MGMDMIDGYQEIKSRSSSAEVLKYPIELRAMTRSRCLYTGVYGTMHPVPQSLADSIIAQHKKEMEE